MGVHKVVPVILRKRGESTEVLAFRHPLGGIQIIKGTVEAGEELQTAAVRELAEESGISTLRSVAFKGTWNSGYKGQTWHFFLCEPEEELPDEWTFFTQDDGGLNFRFFWFDLSEEPDGEWDNIYANALDYIRVKLRAEV